MRAGLLAPLLAVLLAGCSALTPPGGVGKGEAVLRRAVVSADTVWGGTVTLLGPAVVKKGATLTIQPGTIVRFAWIDEDGDGIGDGELNVEGRLLARGTRERPIIFTSARPAPAPRDWTYVMVSTSRDTVIENCVFEHAFTGLQVHFSSAVVRDCLFRGNFEGMRFSTADVLIEHNDFVGNGYGIRYESRGSRTVISRNNLRGNDYGFFPVVKSTSSVRIFENNVESRVYNVKIGEEQREDLDFRNNWWGSADAASVERGFFDRRQEPSIGRVIHQPFLARPVEESGRR